MKSTTQFIVAALLSFCALTSYGQITIESYNYRLPVSPDTAYLQAVVAGQSTINPGNGVNWDLTGLIAGGPIDYVLDPVSSSSFPNADGQVEVPANLGGGLLLDQIYSFYEQDQVSYREVGFEIIGKAFPLGSQTGVSTDSLYTRDTVLMYDAPILKYPVQMGSQWSSNITIWIPMLITVENFSLNKMSFSIRQDVYQSDSVVGYGTVVLPSGASAEALMIHSVQTRVDSVYMGGVPMDPLMASNFGFVQNDTTKLERFALYGKGLNSSLYEYLVVDGNQTQPYFNRSNNIGTTELNVSPFVVFPNPAKEKITVMGDLNDELQLFDLNGRLVKSQEVNSNAAQVDVFVGDLTPGMYVLVNGAQRLKVTVK